MSYLLKSQISEARDFEKLDFNAWTVSNSLKSLERKGVRPDKWVLFFILLSIPLFRHNERPFSINMNLLALTATSEEISDSRKAVLTDVAMVRNHADSQ